MVQYGTVSSRISQIMHRLIHAIQYVTLISIPLRQHFLRKVPRAIFLSRAKKKMVQAKYSA